MPNSAALPNAHETRWIELPAETRQQDFGECVREGLGAAPKSLPSQFFYDAEGSRLFEEICVGRQLDPARLEASVRGHAGFHRQTLA